AGAGGRARRVGGAAGYAGRRGDVPGGAADAARDVAAPAAAALDDRGGTLAGYNRPGRPMSAPFQTEHPHVEKVPGRAGGQPVVAGTRISVAFIVRFLQAGTAPAEIVAAYPHLSLAAVYDAISYYYDHQDEIDRFLAEYTPEALAQRQGFTIDGGRVTFKKR